MNDYNDDEFTDWSRESPVYLHRAPKRSAVDWTKLGIWVGLFAISMLLILGLRLAFTMIVR